MIFQIEKNSMMMKVGKKKHRTCVIFKKISVAQISSRSSHFFGHTHKHTHTHTLLTLYVYVYVYVCVCILAAIYLSCKHPLPTTQETTLHMDITRWSILKSDWLYSLQLKVEKLYTFSRNKTGSWLWLRSWTPYCKSQT